MDAGYFVPSKDQQELVNADRNSFIGDFTLKSEERTPARLDLLQG
jgi:hypothetical protein